MVFSAVIVRASREQQTEAYIPTHMSFISAPPSPLSRNGAPSFTDPFSPVPERRARTRRLARPDDCAGAKHDAGRLRRDSSYTLRASLRSFTPKRASHPSTPPWALRPLEPLAPVHPPAERTRHSVETRESSRPLSRATSRIQMRVPTPAESVQIRVEMRVRGDEGDIELEELEGGERFKGEDIKLV